MGQLELIQSKIYEIRGQRVGFPLSPKARLRLVCVVPICSAIALMVIPFSLHNSLILVRILIIPFKLYRKNREFFAVYTIYDINKS